MKNFLDRILKLLAVLNRIGRSRSSIYDLERSVTFTQRVSINPYRS